MNAYFFTVVTTNSQLAEVPARGGQTVTMPHIWESRSNAIIYADNSGQAQKALERWVAASPEGENPLQVEINRLLAAQFIDQLFAEAGWVPIDWAKSCKEANATQQTTPLDDFEQGYWADVNLLVPPGKSDVDFESLKQGLPEDVRSGVNWSPDKRFFYIVCALSLPLALGQPVVGTQSDPPLEAEMEADPQDLTPPAELSLDFLPPEFADLLARESAALVVARNSIVAAWLWRKFAANTPLAANPVYIAPWCTAFSANDEDDSPAEPAESAT